MVRVFRLLLVGWIVVMPLRSAASAAILFKEVRVGKAIVSLPSHWTTLGPEIPVWVHLHGAPEVVEREFASIGAPGVLVNLTLPGLSKVYADYFAEAPAWTELLRETEAALRRESGAQAWRLGKLTLSSFSAGFGGVRELLKQPEVFARISTLVLADSIYCGYAGDAAAKRVDPALMDGFLRFARAAAAGKKRLLISHSRQVPDGYASTTETADYLISALGGSRSEEFEEWPGGLHLLSRFSQGDFELLGFDGEGPEDHMHHLRGIGSLYARVAPATPASPATSVEELRRRIQALVDAPRHRGAIWSIKIASLDSGRTLFAHHPERRMSPASNSKLYTAALALDHFGGDYRIATPIFTTSQPDGDGVLRGDLVISGRGDPSWKPAPGGDFWSVFAPFVGVVKKAGIRRITGDVVGDATYFRMLPNGAGWTADDLNDYYGAEISAITLEDNFASLRISPATAVAQPARLEVVQPGTGLIVDNRVTTAPANGTRRISAQRIFGENILHVFGTMPAGARPFVEDVTVPRPANWFAAAWREALGREGIVVEGKSRGIRWPEISAVTDAAVKLGEMSSPPLRQLVRDFMKPSQNLETDLIFGHVGEATRAASTPALRTSEQLGVAALRDFLERNQLPADDVQFEEGAGLSRNNLTTANATVALLTFMSRHRERVAFYDALPIAGEDGTLRRRMQDTAAQGNVRAKTGTLRYAISLSGYVTSGAGEKLVFSVMLNRAVSPPGRSAREDVDAIAVMLAQLRAKSEAMGPK